MRQGWYQAWLLLIPEPLQLAVWGITLEIILLCAIPELKDSRTSDNMMQIYRPTHLNRVSNRW